MKCWKVRIVKKKNYSYLPELCAGVLNDVAKGTMKKPKGLTCEDDPKKIAPKIAKSSSSFNIRAYERSHNQILIVTITSINKQHSILLCIQLKSHDIFVCHNYPLALTQPCIILF